MFAYLTLRGIEHSRVYAGDPCRLLWRWLDLPSAGNARSDDLGQIGDGAVLTAEGHGPSGGQKDADIVLLPEEQHIHRGHGGVVASGVRPARALLSHAREGHHVKGTEAGVVG